MNPRERTGNAGTAVLQNTADYIDSTCPVTEAAGSCLQFSSSGYATVDNFTYEAEQFSVQVWAKSNNPTPVLYSAVVASAASQSAHAEGSFQISVRDGDYVFLHASASKGHWDLVIGAVSTEWRHLAVTYDGTTVRTFYDGSLANTAELSGEKGFFNALLVGTNRFVNKPWDGCVDELRIWSTALTETRNSFNKGVRLIGDEPDLKAYWRIDEGAGSTTSDQTVNGYTMSIPSTVTWAKSGCPLGTSYALKCSIPNNHAEASVNSFTTSTYSVELWVHPDRTDQSEYTSAFACKQPHGPSSFQISMNPIEGTQMQQWIFFYTAPDETQYDDIVIGEVKAEWQHLAVTSDGTTVRTYYNGVSVGSVGLDATADFDTYGLGRNRNVDKIFNGAIDEVRVWNVARTGDDIKSAKNSRIVGKEAGLIAYWRFGEEPY